VFWISPQSFSAKTCDVVAQRRGTVAGEPLAHKMRGAPGRGGRNGERGRGRARGRGRTGANGFQTWSASSEDGIHLYGHLLNRRIPITFARLYRIIKTGHEGTIRGYSRSISEKPVNAYKPISATEQEVRVTSKMYSLLLLLLLALSQYSFPYRPSFYRLFLRSSSIYS
jgi:hypothetical protein